MPIIKWEPFEEIDNFFKEVMPARIHGATAFAPAIDLYQDKDNVIAEVYIPGINPDNVEVAIENDVLTIKGKTEQKKEIDDKNYYRKEVRVGSFQRAVQLPIHVKGNKAQASYKDGILKISIPKAEEVKPKTIKINIEK